METPNWRSDSTALSRIEVQRVGKMVNRSLNYRQETRAKKAVARVRHVATMLINQGIQQEEFITKPSLVL